jgi:rhodanese-related sulfurtransferase
MLYSENSLINFDCQSSLLASDDEEKRDTLLDKIKGKVALIRANPKQAAKAAASGVAAGFGIVAGAKATKGAVKAVKVALKPDVVTKLVYCIGVNSRC